MNRLRYVLLFGVLLVFGLQLSGQEGKEAPKGIVVDKDKKSVTIDAKTVLSDDRSFARALNLQSHGTHIDLCNLVHDRQAQNATIEHDALATETGTHQRHLSARLGVEPIEKQDSHEEEGQNDEADDPSQYTPVPPRGKIDIESDAR